MIEKIDITKEDDLTTVINPEKSQLDAFALFGWYVLCILIIQPLWYIFCAIFISKYAPYAPEFVLWLPVLVSFAGIFLSALYRGVSDREWSLMQFSFVFLLVSVIYFMLIAFAGLLYGFYFLGVIF